MLDSELDEVVRILESDKKMPFNVEKNRKHYRLFAKTSFGTFVSFNGPQLSKGINTICKLTLTEENKVQVYLHTRIRFEIYLLLIMWAAFIYSDVFTEENIPLWITLLVLPITIFWFFGIHRMQEKSLQKEVEIYIKESLRDN